MSAGANTAWATLGRASSTPVATSTNSNAMLHRPDSLCRSRNRRIGAAWRLNASALRHSPRGHHAQMPVTSSASIAIPDQPTS